MSVSPIARQIASPQAIPIRKVLVTDASELPNYYSQTPGGTLYSTTPGGTKIVYERNFLLNLRNSPISNTPPRCEIPEVLQRGAGSPPKKVHNNQLPKRNKIPPRSRNDSYNSRNNTEDEQFQIDL
ncbi:eukaryotic translation initiation factor 4E binding protein thor [Rhynchophorus ferrugineus]|uniref:Uncharacterized protein n=1 Tax=Rhynchophorus ferrugineus TaxID=354439 RepID=A0A834M312_RHYFE|nr:hypothetical protein GWI33_020876 [Rhynchophorus ferrugineus]